MDKIGPNIRTIRKALGMTQTELAEKLGTTQYAVTNWERELNNPPAAILPELAKALGVSIPELYGKQAIQQDAGAKKPSARSRAQQMQKLFEELNPTTQRVVLSQVKALAQSQH
jgi:transcriptional regulator with XRE-family HTH domain